MASLATTEAPFENDAIYDAFSQDLKTSAELTFLLERNKLAASQIDAINSLIESSRIAEAKSLIEQLYQQHAPATQPQQPCPEELKPGCNPEQAATFMVNWLTGQLASSNRLAPRNEGGKQTVLGIALLESEVRIAVSHALGNHFPNRVEEDPIIALLAASNKTLALSDGARGEWQRLRTRADFYSAVKDYLRSYQPSVTSPIVMADIAGKMAHVAGSKLSQGKLDKHPQLAANLLLISRLVRMYDEERFANLLTQKTFSSNQAQQFDQQTLAEIQLLLQPLFDILDDRITEQIDAILGAKGIIGRVAHAAVATFLGGHFPKMVGTIQDPDDRFHYSEQLAPANYQDSKQEAEALTANQEIKNGQLFVTYCRKIHAAMTKLPA